MPIANGRIYFLTPGSDESLAALPSLAEFATALGCQLTILHMLGRSDGGRRVDAALAALAPGGQPPELLTTPADEVADVLERVAAPTGGILVLLPRRPHALDRLLVGNEYEQLLQSGPLPVLALPASGRIGRPARVLFPADLSPRSATAFGETVALCRALGAELHLLHVFGDDRLLPSEVDQVRRTAAQNPRELLTLDQELLRQLADFAADQQVHATPQTAEGRAHDQIVRYAASAAIDLIVMSSHGPRSVEDILRGSTTLRVVQKAPVAVLAMRG
jgi:nucleotide-binding universal stress UspA family protein